MLKLMAQDKPHESKMLHEAAANFYATKKEPEARAEELYHRMMLNEEATTLNARWIDSAGPSLARSLDDYPARATAWLASRMNLDVSPEISRLASAEEWERFAGQKVRDSIRFLNPAGALAILAGRTDRTPASVLYILEARAYVLKGDLTSAATVLDTAIASFPPQPNRGRVAEFFWVRAEVAREMGDIAESDVFLEQAQQTALTIANALCRLQIITERLILRKYPNAPLAHEPSLEALVGDALGRLDGWQVASSAD